MFVTLLLLTVYIIDLLSADHCADGAQQITANIPFAFNVGEKSFSAGEYTIVCTNTASDRKVLQLRGKDGSILVQTNSVIGQTNEQAKLVFNRYGDRYYFSQAWLAAYNTGMQVSKSRSEKATANELASIKRATEMVALSRKR